MAASVREILELLRQLVELHKQQAKGQSSPDANEPTGAAKTKKAKRVPSQEVRKRQAVQRRSSRAARNARRAHRTPPASASPFRKFSSLPKRSTPRAVPVPTRAVPAHALPLAPKSGVVTVPTGPQQKATAAPGPKPKPLPPLRAPKIATRARLEKVRQRTPRRQKKAPLPLSRWRATENLLGAAGNFAPPLGQLAAFMRNLRQLHEAFEKFGQAWTPRSRTGSPAATPTTTPVRAAGRSTPASLQRLAARGRQTLAGAVAKVGRFGQRAQRRLRAAMRLGRQKTARLLPAAKAMHQKVRGLVAGVLTSTVTPAPKTPVPGRAMRPSVPPFFRRDLLYQMPMVAAQLTATKAIGAGMSPAQVHEVRRQAIDFYSKHTRNRHARLQMELLRGRAAGLGGQELRQKAERSVEDYLGRRSRPTTLAKAGNPLAGGGEGELGSGKGVQLLERIALLLEQLRDQGVKHDTGQLWPRDERAARRNRAVPGGLSEAAGRSGGGLGKLAADAAKDAALSWARAAIAAAI